MADREIIRLHRTRDLINGVSPSFCLAKWFQTTLYLQNGYSHSCHHPPPHKITLDELRDNPSALHNTQQKATERQMMLQGEKPSGCDYCWRVESLGEEHISDRTYKSATTWALPRLGEALEAGTGPVVPGYLEVSFSSTCNFKCVYCSPEISSQWYKEIERHGAYPTSNNYGSLAGLKQQERLPIDPNGYNPYVEAFWQWWPELYPQLHTLRITGGEPLLSRDTWRVLDHITGNPRADLTVCINTNLGVQPELIDRLIHKLNEITPLVKEVQVFSSGEAVGVQAEYTRTGLNYPVWQHNMERIAHECPGVLLANMTTVNILSVPTFARFVYWLLELREHYNAGASFNRIQFMVNYLRYPRFLEVTNLTPDVKERFQASLTELIQTRGHSYTGLGRLTDSEINQIERLIDFANTQPWSPVELNTNRADFAAYVDELDVRRNCDFKSTFPELLDYYTLCQRN